MGTRSLSLSGLAYACAVAIIMSLPGTASSGERAHAGGSLEERKLPMHFGWHAPVPDGGAEHTGEARQNVVACTGTCRGWVSAVGIITADTPTEFDDFAVGRDLRGATIVLDSSGGSVIDAIKLGRQWRDLGVTTTVGTVTEAHSASGERAEIYPDAYCESMCVFLLLSGKTRFVPAAAHVRVHQIWMGDRAEDATAANYSAQDVMIIERDVGRLAKYTFEMGGTGELLGLALSIPPWEPLHELTLAELRLSNLVSMDAVADLAAPLPGGLVGAPRGDKPVQDRFVASRAADSDAAEPTASASSAAPRSTKTAEALPASARAESTQP